MRPQTLGKKQGADCGTFMPGWSASPYKLYKSPQIRTVEFRAKLNLTLNGSATKIKDISF
jgi:hypothetical protein